MSETVIHSTMTDEEVDTILSCGCLGCLLDARARGQIDEETYDALMANLAEQEQRGEGTCPGCGNPHGVVSEYDPDVMHCPACGLYSERLWYEGVGDWTPLRQGTALTRSSSRHGRSWREVG